MCVGVLWSLQGNSNNIGTVDISVGFVGLESYVEAPAISWRRWAPTQDRCSGPVICCVSSAHRETGNTHTHTHTQAHVVGLELYDLVVFW